MDQQKLEKIVERLNKLRTLAHDKGATEAEATNAMEKFHAILAQYNLELSDLDKDDENIIVESNDNTPTHAWRDQINTAVAELFFCQHFILRLKGSRTLHTFTGAAHNVLVAKEIAAYLCKTVDRLARDGAKSLPLEQQSPYRASFRAQCTARLCFRIRQRIKEAKAGHVHAEGSGTALVLASYYDTELARVRDYIEAKYGKLKATRTRGQFMGSDRGVRDGDEAGKGISLEHQVGREKKREIR